MGLNFLWLQAGGSGEKDTGRLTLNGAHPAGAGSRQVKEHSSLCSTKRFTPDSDLQALFQTPGTLRILKNFTEQELSESLPSGMKSLVAHKGLKFIRLEVLRPNVCSLAMHSVVYHIPI